MQKKEKSIIAVIIDLFTIIKSMLGSKLESYGATIDTIKEMRKLESYKTLLSDKKQKLEIETEEHAIQESSIILNAQTSVCEVNKMGTLGNKSEFILDYSRKKLEKMVARINNALNIVEEIDSAIRQLDQQISEYRRKISDDDCLQIASLIAKKYILSYYIRCLKNRRIVKQLNQISSEKILSFLREYCLNVDELLGIINNENLMPTIISNEQLNIISKQLEEELAPFVDKLIEAVNKNVPTKTILGLIEQLLTGEDHGTPGIGSPTGPTRMPDWMKHQH